MSRKRLLQNAPKMFSQSTPQEEEPAVIADRALTFIEDKINKQIKLNFDNGLSTVIYNKIIKDKPNIRAAFIHDSKSSLSAWIHINKYVENLQKMSTQQKKQVRNYDDTLRTAIQIREQLEKVKSAYFTQGVDAGVIPKPSKLPGKPPG